MTPLQHSTGNGSPFQRFSEYLCNRGLKRQTISKYLREWEIVEREAFSGNAWPSPKNAKALMASYLRLLAAKKIANSVIRRRLFTAIRFYEAMGSPNVLKGIRISKRPETKLKIIPRTQLISLRHKLELESDTLRDVCNLIFFTGLRLSEIVSLKFNKQDLKARRLIVNGRIVVIGENAAKILGRRISGNVKWLKQPQWYSDRLRKISPGITPIMLRNTFAMEALYQGQSINFIMAQMGLRSQVVMRSIVAAYMDY